MNQLNLSVTQNNIIYVNFKKGVTVGELLPLFEESINTRQIQSNTKAFYSNMLKHVAKHLHDNNICDIDNNRVIKFLDIAQQKDNGKIYSEKTMKSIKLVLSLFFDWCVEHKYIQENPVATKKIRNEYGIPNIYHERWVPIKELKIVLKYLKDNKRYSILVNFIAKSGLRIGEVLALCWEDVDLVQKEIRITKALVEEVYTSSKGTQVSKYVVGKTKNRQSNRVVPISQSLEKIILEWMRYSKATDTYNEKIFFPNQDGRHHNYNTLQNNFQEYLSRQGYNGYRGNNVTFHMLRHTYGSWLLSQGASIVVISRLLGHSSVRVTEDIYLGVSLEQKREAAELCNTMFQ